jgi:hypothetical protein
MSGPFYSGQTGPLAVQLLNELFFRVGTSVSSATIATGTFSITTQAGLGLIPNQPVTIANGATNYVYGPVVSYNGGSGALVVTVTVTRGSGTYSSWIVNAAGIPGLTGPVGSLTDASRVFIGGPGDDGASNLQVAGPTRLAGTLAVSSAINAAGVINAAGSIASTVTEGLKLANSAGYISGYDTANTTRTGYLQFNSGSNVTLAAEGGGSILLAAGGATRLTLSPTGALTGGAASFTTLTASGAATVGAGLSVTGTVSTSGTLTVGNTSNPSGAAIYARIATDQNFEVLAPGLSATGVRVWGRTNAGAVAPLELQSNTLKFVDETGVLRGLVNSSGLAVTGAVSASGAITANGGINNAAGQSIQSNDIRSYSGSDLNISGIGVGGLGLWSNGSRTAYLTNTTFAVTGAISASGTVTTPGIAFPATQVPSSDANTLDDYEEGTWTPVDSSGAGLTFTDIVATYTKVGRQVTCQMKFFFPATANATAITIGGLPFAAGAYGPTSIQVSFVATTATITSRGGYGPSGGTTFTIDKNNATAVATNADFSGALTYATATYFV